MSLPPARSWGSPESLWFVLVLLGKKPLWSPDFGPDHFVLRQIRYAPRKIEMLEAAVSPTGAHFEARIVDPSRPVTFEFGSEGLKVVSATLEAQWSVRIKESAMALLEGVGSDSGDPENSCIEVAGRYWHRVLNDSKEESASLARALLADLGIRVANEVLNSEIPSGGL